MDLEGNKFKNFTGDERSALKLSPDTVEMKVEDFSEKLELAFKRIHGELDAVRNGHTRGVNPAHETGVLENHLAILNELGVQLLMVEVGDGPADRFHDGAA